LQTPEAREHAMEKITNPSTRLRLLRRHKMASRRGANSILIRAVRPLARHTQQKGPLV
jgi:hypothetical protein